MFRQALRLIWNRRRSEALVVIEIALAFVAAFAVLAICVTYWTNYTQPLGFDYDRMWRVQLRYGTSLSANSGWDVQQAQTLRNLLQALRDLPQVEAAHVIRTTPFSSSRTKGPYLYDGHSVLPVATNAMTSGALQTIGTSLAAGRWFDQTDEGQPYRAAIVNRAYVAEAFGAGEDPLGKNINQIVAHPPPGASLDELPPFLRRDVRIVGVVEHLRPHDLFAEAPLVVIQYEVEHAVENAVEDPKSVFVKVAPGTPAAFEKEIVATLNSVAPQWGALIESWSSLRDLHHKRVLMPFLIFATLVAFVLLMVVLGLVGVVWQGVVRRTQEIGLRRALGATAGDVHRQVMLELLVTAAFGVALGMAIAVQFPVLGLIPPIDWNSAIPSLGLTAVLILGLVALSAAYPGWMASRREPADALRYE